MARTETFRLRRSITNSGNIGSYTKRRKKKTATSGNNAGIPGWWGFEQNLKSHMTQLSLSICDIMDMPFYAFEIQSQVLNAPMTEAEWKEQRKNGNGETMSKEELGLNFD